MSFNAKDYLTADEIRSLLEKSDWKAAYEIAHTWFWISIAFALATFFPDPFTIVVSLFMLGGKQLACAILMHDTSHYAQF
jgi:fatty acid desaturase